MDCVDPDCCEQLSCSSDPLCHGSADPLALLQQSPLPSNGPPASAGTHAHGFYSRIHFLLGKAATHTLPGDVPFDTRYALVYFRRTWLCERMQIASGICFPALRPSGVSLCRTTWKADKTLLYKWIMMSRIQFSFNEGVSICIWKYFVHLITISLLHLYWCLIILWLVQEVTEISPMRSDKVIGWQ